MWAAPRQPRRSRARPLTWSTRSPARARRPTSDPDAPAKPISVGSYSYPLDVAFVPSRATAVVLDAYSGQVTLLNTRARRALRPIKVGGYPAAIAIVP